MMYDKYPFTEGNPLISRNRYDYVSYQGMEFIQLWRQDRECIINEVDNCIQPPESQVSKFSFNGFYDTSALLEYLIYQVDKEPENLNKIYVDKIIQRFEVSKRIHEKYNDQWKPVDPNQFNNIILYIRFAELMDRYYRMTHGFDALNALLKVNDTLIASRSGLSDNLKGRLKYLVSSEMHHIESISFPS